jgi:hypothetical protein
MSPAWAELLPLMGLSGERLCSMDGGAPLTCEVQSVAASALAVEPSSRMSPTWSRAQGTAVTQKIDMKLEVVVIPVAVGS